MRFSVCKHDIKAARSQKSPPRPLVTSALNTYNGTFKLTWCVYIRRGTSAIVMSVAIAEFMNLTILSEVA